MGYFRCYGFTEIEGHRKEVDILIGHENINRARIISSWYITNVSHFEEYPLELTEFGVASFIINHQGEKVNIISSVGTIKEAFKLLTDIGMDIKSVDSLAHPLQPNIQHIIWGMLRLEFGLSNDDPFTSEIEEDEAVDGQYTATQLIKIADLIAHILQDAKELYVRIKGVIGGDNFALLARSIEQLQQTLNQGQIMIAKEQTKKLISLMEQVEGEYIEYERVRDHQIESQITIPNLNTILAHNQWVTAHKLYEMQSAENHKVEQRYQTIYLHLFQKTLLYYKGVMSEMKGIIGVNNNIVKYFVRKVEYSLIFMSMFTMIILQMGGHDTYRGNTMYVIGFAGLALQSYYIVTTSNHLLKLGIVTMMVLAIGVVGYIGASNLALI